MIDAPYLHALDTRTRRVYRTFVPEPAPRRNWWWRVRLKADRAEVRVLAGPHVLARVNAATHRLVTRARPKAGDGGISWLAFAGPSVLLIPLTALGARLLSASRRGGLSVEGCQVELVEALGVREEVHCDDPSVSDREARYGERLPVPERDRACRAVD